jgi:hypothetical protein
VAATQGNLTVPLPARPSDWERDVGGLAAAALISADMAFRRTALEAARGFDERFPRAYREDAELSCRLLAAGWSVVRGRREVVHPVPPAGRLVSVRRQAGNRDDALMCALHGRNWRVRARVPRGRRRRHVAITAAGAVASAALAARRRRLARAGLVLWLAGTTELAVARIAPGPRTPGEIATMAGTSVLLPPAATAWWLLGIGRWRLGARPSALPTVGPTGR